MRQTENVKQKATIDEFLCLNHDLAKMYFVFCIADTQSQINTTHLCFLTHVHLQLVLRSKYFIRQSYIPHSCFQNEAIHPVLLLFHFKRSRIMLRFTVRELCGWKVGKAGNQFSRERAFCMETHWWICTMMITDSLLVLKTGAQHPQAKKARDLVLSSIAWIIKVKERKMIIFLHLHKSYWNKLVSKLRSILLPC